MVWCECVCRTAIRKRQPCQLELADEQLEVERPTVSELIVFGTAIKRSSATSSSGPEGFGA